jgi:hypothetical protein
MTDASHDDRGDDVTTSRTRQSRLESDRYEDEYDEPPRRGGRGSSGGLAARRFGLPVVAAALVGGLFVGYIVSSGGSGTATVTETKTVSAPDATASAPGAATASGAASRASINLAVLNGSSQSGLARGTADTAEGLGYQNVFAADAPSPATSSQVVYREGFAPQAQQVADDLQLPAPVPATVGSGVLAVAPDAQVVVVLGASATTGAAAGTDSGAATGSGASTAPTDGTAPTE